MKKKKQIRLNTLQKITHYLNTELPVECSQYDKTEAEVLEYTKRLLDQLGEPPSGVPVIHVGGSSGKGSVCYMIDAILRAHDQHTALIISPHVYDSRERIQLNGQLAPERMYIQLVNQVLSAAHQLSDLGDKPSYTSIMAAISLLGTTKKRIGYIVVEAGLGGEYDVTNLVKSAKKHAVLTQIGGENIVQTAQDASVIMSKDGTVTALSQVPEVNEVFTKAASARHSSIEFIESNNDYQTDNILLALNAAQAIAERDGWHFDSEVARLAIETVYIPGRYEKRRLHNTLVILDGAHNPQNMSALARRLRSEEHTQLDIVFALSSTKDIADTLRPLQGICRRLVITEFFADRGYVHRPSHPADEIKATAQALGFSNIDIETKPDKALIQTTKAGEIVLVTGSFYLLSELDRVF